MSKSAIQCVLLFTVRSGSGISLCSGPGVEPSLPLAWSPNSDRIVKRRPVPVTDAS